MEVAILACRVVCISRSLAAGGEEVGLTVAKELGFRYADEKIIIRAAEKAGVSPELVADAERTPSLIARILESMARTPPSPEGWFGAAILPPNTRPDYESLIEKVVRETANEGNVVIVAHGASLTLGDLRGVLRVLVTASPAVRSERLVREAKLDEQAAKKAVDESDHQRREYLQRFHNVRRELPTHYDLVINTDVLTVPLAAGLIASAAKG